MADTDSMTSTNDNSKSKSDDDSMRIADLHLLIKYEHIHSTTSNISLTLRTANAVMLFRSSVEEFHAAKKNPFIPYADAFHIITRRFNEGPGVPGSSDLFTSNLVFEGRHGLELLAATQYQYGSARVTLESLLRILQEAMDDKVYSVVNDETMITWDTYGCGEVNKEKLPSLGRDLGLRQHSATTLPSL